MKAWAHIPLSKLLAQPVRAGIYVPKNQRGTGTPLINMGQLFAHDRIGAPEMERVPISEEQRRNYVVQAGDLLMARLSLKLDGVGKVSLVSEADEDRVWDGSIFRLRFNAAKADSRFYFYYFQAPAGRHQLLSIVQQTAAAGIRGSELARLDVPAPPLSQQRAIARCLEMFDEKIELNGRINSTLEAMARALFKSWFIDFDPVHAKAQGRDPGLPKHLADLFPGSMEDAERGVIPQGWHESTLGELSEQPQYGYTASASRELIGPKFLRITDINKKPWIDWATVPHCLISDKDLRRYGLQVGDIVIARMADPGHGAMIEEVVPSVFASYLIRFRPTEAAYSRFLQYWLRSDGYWDLVKARRTGTTRASLNAQVLGAFQLVRPPLALAHAFSIAIESLRSKVVANVAEAQVLASARNALLPKFVSGELRVESG